ncbi:MAG: zinc ribbon domain-containing protein, partial [Roseiflexaceae bacterium]
MARCQDCGEHSPDHASFCIVCGARLIAPTARTRVPLPPAVGPTIRLSVADVARPDPAGVPVDPVARPAARLSIRQALVPLVGLAFGITVVLELAQLLALNGLRATTVWLIVVLLGGVLLAESAWVNGHLWRGLRGMLLWGGLLGLLAFDHLMPWVVALALGWLALHPSWYGRHT